MTSSPSILVVDDEPLNVSLLEAFLAPKGYNVLTATNGQQAIDIVKKSTVDLILLDVRMPILSGIEVCKTLKADPEFQLIPIIMISALSKMQDRIDGLDVGALEYITKPYNLDELYARVKASLKVKALTDHLESAEKVLISLAAAVEARDEYTGFHIDRVTKLATALGEKLNLPEQELDDIRIGARLHDIGKIGTPDSILLKPGRLTSDEFDEIKKHAKKGYDLCFGLKTIGNGLDLILHHHEKLDGSGYPVGLSGDEINLPIRILTVADIFDALTSSRCYRKGLSLEKAFEILFSEVKEQKIDGDVVNALKELHENGAEFHQRN